MIAKDLSDIDSFRRSVNVRCVDCKKRVRLDKAIHTATRKSYRKTGFDMLCPDCAWKHVRVI
jgi:hypothetical protein